MELSKIFPPDTATFINKINQLGLDGQWFRQIGARILSEYTLTTPNDARCASGLYAYLAGVRATRDILVGHGFKPLSQNNVESTYREIDNFKIIISSGCSNTGKNNGKDPATKNPKGRKLKKIIYYNPNQYLLPGIKSNLKPGNVWLLLFHIDEEREELRMELSRPYQMEINGEKERIDRWCERLILSPIEFNSQPTLKKPEFSSEIDIEIKRRSNEK